MFRNDTSIFSQQQEWVSSSSSDNFYKHHHQWVNSKDCDCDV